ncbi:MAG: HPF/RaiA family ribosome-associated protein [Chitinophagaceae bacterium]|nr:HPF/RaiA family ribosome-associated protein [Chitinophagaceae bacterium]
MDIIIQSLGFTAGEDLETFVHERLVKFNKESTIIRANVTLFIGSDGNQNKYCCEIRLEVPGNDLFVKKNADTFEKAIVSAADALQRSRRRAKDKLIDRRQDGPTEKV